MALNFLKQRARAFVAAHGVSYATALRAVDEPLHELRDLLEHASGIILISREGSYGLAYPDQAIEQTRRSELHQVELRSYTKELARRMELFERFEVSNIWGYRELYRAGLLPEGSPAIEPIFHHYSTCLDYSLRSMFELGDELGFYPVNLSGPFYSTERHSLRAITEQQLNDLKAGRTAGPLENRRFKRSESSEPRVEGFGTLAYYIGDGADWVPRMTVLIKGDREAMIRELEARDLKPRHFTIEDVSQDEIALLEYGSVEIFKNGERFIWGTQDRLIIVR